MVTSIDRRRVVTSLAALPALAFPAVAQAADKFPSQPFIILNSSVPGGYQDNLSRALTPYLSKNLGQNLTQKHLERLDTA